MSFAKAQSSIADDRESLNLLLGVWGDQVHWQLEGELDPNVAREMDMDRLETRSIAASFSLAEQRAKLNALAQKAELVSWETLFPTLEAGMAAKREPSDDWGLGPSIGFSLPIFDQGQASNFHAASLLRQTWNQYTSLAIETRVAARALRERFLSLQEQAQFMEKALLPVQHRAVIETLQNYNAMQIGAFDVIAIKQEEIEARYEYITVLRDAWLARLDLEELLAGSLGGFHQKGHK